jgi:hypothetical protein
VFIVLFSNVPSPSSYRFLPESILTLSFLLGTAFYSASSSSSWSSAWSGSKSFSPNMSVTAEIVRNKRSRRAIRCVVPPFVVVGGVVGEEEEEEDVE